MAFIGILFVTLRVCLHASKNEGFKNVNNDNNNNNNKKYNI